MRNIQNKKAQTATEYMIILAVVIIIALIVVGVMGGIPGIGASTQSNVDSAVWQSGTIGIMSYAARSSDDTVKIRIKNNKNGPITVWFFNMSSSGSTIANIDLISDANGVTLGKGEERDISTVVSNICNQAGDSWISHIWVKYKEDSSGYNYTYNGNGKTLSGVCAS